MQRLSSSLFCTSRQTLPLLTLSGSRSLHISSPQNAVALPITATGPPPSAPVSATSDQIARRRRRAELLKHGRNLRADQTQPEDRLKKRFWKDVNVKTDSGMFFSMENNQHPPVDLLFSPITQHTYTHRNTTLKSYLYFSTI